MNKLDVLLTFFKVTVNCEPMGIFFIENKQQAYTSLLF